MPLLPSTVKAQIDDRLVGAALFVEFQFKSGAMRVWEGDGPLTRGGHDWRGMGSRTDGLGNPLQSIDGLEQAVNGNAPQLNLTLSGVDATVVTAARADADADEIESRDVTVYIGFFDATVPMAGLTPLDDLLPLGTWTMQRPVFTSSGPSLRTISLPCETLFAQRSRAPFGMLTDRDQQRRFPGDRALEFVPKMIDRTVTWPRFLIPLALMLPFLPHWFGGMAS